MCLCCVDRTVAAAAYNLAVAALIVATVLWANADAQVWFENYRGAVMSISSSLSPSFFTLGDCLETHCTDD